MKALLADVKTKRNNAENDVTSNVRLALHQNLQDLANFEDNEERSQTFS